MSDPLSDARATVLDPARVHLKPSLMQDAWSQLKEARGQRVARPELLQPAHIIVAASDGGTVAQIDIVRGRVSETVRRMMAWPHSGGDAA